MGIYVITGGTTGIGAAAREMLLGQGYEVFNIDYKGGDFEADLSTDEGVQVAIRCVEERNHEGHRKPLNLDCRMAMGGTVGEFLASFNRPVNHEIIHTCDDPLYPDGCYSVLYGGCLVKKSGVVPEMFHHRGPAVCFDSEDDLREAMANKQIKPGCVLVIRYEGPKGGPGMREMSIPVILIPFLITGFSKFAQGSASVAALLAQDYRCLCVKPG